MSAWILTVEGTEVGHQLAMVLALSAAFLHAVFGALQKGQHDPWLSRGAIDICYFMMAMPIAVFVLPWPEPGLWLIFLGMVIIFVCPVYSSSSVWVGLSRPSLIT